MSVRERSREAEWEWEKDSKSARQIMGVSSNEMSVYMWKTLNELKKTLQRNFMLYNIRMEIRKDCR